MTTIEDEKGYEIAKQYLEKKYAGDYVDFIETEGQAYLDGYEQGYEDCRHYAHDYYKPKWHDLRKNPDDLPKETGHYLTDDGECIYNADFKRWRTLKCMACWDFHWLYDGDVLAWCELPKVEECI